MARRISEMGTFAIESHVPRFARRSCHRFKFSAERT
jgi:hypothetical protein